MKSALLIALLALALFLLVDQARAEISSPMPAPISPAPSGPAPDTLTWGEGDSATVISQTTVERIARAIAQQEGFGVDPENVPTRDHNPGDLAGWPGYPVDTRSEQGNITRFPDDATGWQKLYLDIRNHFSNTGNADQTIDQFIQSYANQPSGSGYANAVAAALGVSPETTLGELT